jgi:hypothetical protein
MDGHCFYTQWTKATIMAKDDEATNAAIANYTGPVTRCPPGQANAPNVREYGQAQFKCVCGNAGTMPYRKLFKRLRRQRPLRLRCERCGRVLR